MQAYEYDNGFITVQHPLRAHTYGNPRGSSHTYDSPVTVTVIWTATTIRVCCVSDTTL